MQVVWGWTAVVLAVAAVRTGSPWALLAGVAAFGVVVALEKYSQGPP